MVLNLIQKINIRKTIVWIVYIVVVIFALLAISSKTSIGGFKILVVRSGSMEPAIKTGSMVIDKKFSEYNVGDVITFSSPGGGNDLTTHRIVSGEQGASMPLYTTRGDANDTNDSGKLTSGNIVGKVLISIPYLGYIVAFARTLPGLLLIIIPAIIIIYEEMKTIHKESKELIRKRKEKKELAKKDGEAPINDKPVIVTIPKNKKITKEGKK